MKVIQQEMLRVLKFFSGGKLFLVKSVALDLFRENFKMWKKCGKQSGRGIKITFSNLCFWYIYIYTLAPILVF